MIDTAVLSEITASQKEDKELPLKVNNRVKNKVLAILPPETVCLFRLSGLSYLDIGTLLDMRKGVVYNIVRFYQNGCPKIYNGYEPIPTKTLKKWLASDDDLVSITEKCKQRYGAKIPSTLIYTVQDKEMTFTVDIVPHGIMSYASDYGINPRNQKKEKIESFRRQKWSWKKISYYYDLKPFTIRMFVHRALFPAEDLYKYYMQGTSAEEILRTISPDQQKFYGLSLTVIEDLLKRCVEGRYS